PILLNLSSPRNHHLERPLACHCAPDFDLAAIESVAPIALPLDANHTHFCAYIEDTGAGAQSRTTLSQTVCRLIRLIRCPLLTQSGHVALRPPSRSRRDNCYDGRSELGGKKKCGDATSSV